MTKLISLDFDDCLYDLMSLNVKYVKDKYGVINIHRKIKTITTYIILTQVLVTIYGIILRTIYKENFYKELRNSMLS